jgi:hypothetical protein
MTPMRRWLVWPIAAILVLAFTVVWAAFATWCQHFFGFANGDGNGSHYLFFSGVGSDITELTVLAAAGHIYWRFSCHEPKCFWPGHLMADGHTRSCWHHHPEGRPQRGHVARKHAEHKARTAAGM